jgi:hypothetical protein
MAVERYSAADQEHERRVEAFLASQPKRRLDRVEARYAVLRDSDLRRIGKREACWEGQVLDELLLVSVEAERHGFAPTGSSVGCVNRAVSALNLGGPVFTAELGEEGLPRIRPGDAAFWRPEPADETIR